jgi:hypothetical protein
MKTLNSAVKKELTKQVLKVRGSHIGTVKHAMSIQFPSVDLCEYTEFINNLFIQKYK